MKAPDYLDAPAQAKWVEVFPILESRGDVDQGVLDALAAYCSAWSQWTEAQTKVKELGLVVKTPAGFPQENPYAVIARKAQNELRRWGDLLGFNPTARKRLGAMRKKADPKESQDSRIDLMLLERSLSARRARIDRN